MEKAHFKSIRYPKFKHNDQDCVIASRLPPTEGDRDYKLRTKQDKVYGAWIKFDNEPHLFLVNIVEDLPDSPLQIIPPEISK